MKAVNMHAGSNCHTICYMAAEFSMTSDPNVKAKIWGRMTSTRWTWGQWQIFYVHCR